MLTPKQLCALRKAEEFPNGYYQHQLGEYARMNEWLRAKGYVTKFIREHGPSKNPVFVMTVLGLSVLAEANEECDAT